MVNQSKKSSFMKQAVILATAGLLVRFLGLLYRIPLTSMIGDEGNGIYSAGFYLYNFFLVISSAGLPSAISKMVSEKIALGEYKNAKKIFKVSLVISSLIGFTCSLLMFVFAKKFCEIINSPRSYYAILTLSPTVFIVSIMAVFRGYFQGLGTTIPTAISQIIEQIFNAIFSIYLAYILIRFGIEFGSAGGTAGTGIGALSGLIFIFIYFLFSKNKINNTFLKHTECNNYNIQSNLSISKKLILTAIPIITGTAIFSLTNLIDMQLVNSRLAVSGVFSQQQIDSLYGQLTGKYTTLTTLPVSLSTALATAVIPSIASSFVLKDKKSVNNKISTTLRVSMLISIPSSLGMAVLSNQIIMLLFPKFSDGGYLLKYGALSIIFLSLSQTLTGILQGIGKINSPAKNSLIGCIFKIPINYILIAIPSINIIGAVISTTICYFIVSTLNLKDLVKSTEFNINLKSAILKPLFASIIMSLISILSYKIFFALSNNNTFSTVITIFIAILIYGFIIIIIKGVERSDLLLIPMGDKLIKTLEKYNLI